MNMNKKILPALLLAVCCWAGASAQQVAVKTNLLYWAAATPNVGAEVAVGKHSTLGFSANYNPWTIGSDNKIQHWFIRPEYRYWVTEKYTRLFFGVHAIGGKFEVGGFKLPFIGDKVFKGLQTNYYKGSFVGAGISIGYQFYVSPHWNLELSAGAGLAVAALSLRAQIVGDVAVTRKVLAERGGELHMVLEISVSRKAVTRSQSWTILPELSTPDRKSVKLFPHILINGRYQQHMQERRRRLSGAYWAERQPYMTINADKKTDQVFRYEMKVPYESWMAGATLVLRQVQTSPGGVRRVFTVDVNGAVDVSRK